MKPLSFFESEFLRLNSKLIQQLTSKYWYLLMNNFFFSRNGRSNEFYSYFVVLFATSRPHISKSFIIPFEKCNNSKGTIHTICIFHET